MMRTSVEKCPVCGKNRKREFWSGGYESGSFLQRCPSDKCPSNSKRPTWDAYFMDIARAVARRSSCPRASIGAVLVSPDHRILGTGYNGSPIGEPHCFESGCLIEDGHCQRALHAEVNAVAFAARHGVRIEGARLYVTTDERPVCRECAKVLAAAGVVVVEETA